MKILVLGYYYRQNLGDDQFEYVLARFFQDYQRKTQTEPFKQNLAETN